MEKNNTIITAATGSCHTREEAKKVTNDAGFGVAEQDKKSYVHD